MSANYGDVALNLSPTWTRSAQPQNNMMAMNIGHRDGTADVFLTATPAERHQFAWVDMNHPTDLDNYRDGGYEFVTRAKWTASRWRWAEKGEGTWNAEGKLRGLGGQLLMARPERLYIEELEAKAEAQKPTNKAREDAVAFAEANGIAVHDGAGRLLNKVSK